MPHCYPTSLAELCNSPKSPCIGSCLPRSILAAIILLLSVSLSPHSSPAAQEHSHSGHQHDTASTPGSSPADKAKLLADQRESEFNHHLVGFFVALAGLWVLAHGTMLRSWPPIRYAWPVCFLLAGLFVLIFSDTELWPFGTQAWLTGLATHREVFQHKTFAVILLSLGTIEFQRARGRLTAAWVRWIFPVLVSMGSALLLFHEHRSGMVGVDHIERMARIQSEHASYAAAGFGIALSKSLSEMKFPWQFVFAKLWPTLMTLLGILLMLYQE
ncbi:MAG TPA: hypothetical protein VOA64_00375 [Candidatus Dormibacteraeota bacterium]|nr:hypothetical protein [Candidatus Dormibacteraeota bacterium]